MATVRKSKTRSRRQFIQATALAPLAAGLAVEAQGGNKPGSDYQVKSSCDNGNLKPAAPSPAFDPFDLFVAVVTSYGDSRVAFASLVESEIESYCVAFNRMNQGHHVQASMACVRVPTPGPKVEVFGAMIERKGQPREICSVCTDKGFAEGFASVWNRLSTVEGYKSKARVVRGVAQFPGGQR